MDRQLSDALARWHRARRAYHDARATFLTPDPTPTGPELSAAVELGEAADAYAGRAARTQRCYLYADPAYRDERHRYSHATALDAADDAYSDSLSAGHSHADAYRDAAEAARNEGATWSEGEEAARFAEARYRTDPEQDHAGITAAIYQYSLTRAYRPDEAENDAIQTAVDHGILAHRAPALASAIATYSAAREAGQDDAAAMAAALRAYDDATDGDPQEADEGAPRAPEAAEDDPIRYAMDRAAAVYDASIAAGESPAAALESAVNTYSMVREDPAADRAEQEQRRLARLAYDPIQHPPHGPDDDCPICYAAADDCPICDAAAAAEAAAPDDHQPPAAETLAADAIAAAWIDRRAQELEDARAALARHARWIVAQNGSATEAAHRELERLAEDVHRAEQTLDNTRRNLA